MTKRSYVEAVLAGFDAAGVSPCMTTGTKDASHKIARNGLQTSEVPDKPNVHVRLLLSIDRRESADAAMDTVGTYHLPLNSTEHVFIETEIPKFTLHRSRGCD